MEKEPKPLHAWYPSNITILVTAIFIEGGMMFRGVGNATTIAVGSVAQALEATQRNALPRMGLGGVAPWLGTRVSIRRRATSSPLTSGDV